LFSGRGDQEGAAEGDRSPSVVTYRELQKNPETSGNDAEVLAPTLDQANTIAKRLGALSEVSRTLTLSSFIPANQDQKTATIKSASKDLASALHPPRPKSSMMGIQFRPR
jgi:hypothetical protein